MQSRVVRFGTVGLVALIAFAVVGILVMSLPTPAHGAEIDNRPDMTELKGEVHALRAISVPFGIASPLTLSSGGHDIEVTGHGTCLDEGTFDVRVFIVQETTDALGIGRTEGECPTLKNNEEWTWEAQAQTPAVALPAFEAGDARACASAEVRTVDRNGAITTITKWWCKDVVLE